MSLNYYVNTSHYQAQQSCKPYKGFEFFVHHLENEFFSLVHIHYVDAFSNNLTDIDRLEILWMMICNDIAID